MKCEETLYGESPYKVGDPEMTLSDRVGLKLEM